MTWTEQDGIHTLERGGERLAEVGEQYDGKGWKADIADFALSGSWKSAEWAKKAVEEILSLLQPKAKELVWLGREAKTPFGHFSVHTVKEKWRAWFFPYKGDHWIKTCAGKEEAQAACQSHFDALVQEMIE